MSIASTEGKLDLDRIQKEIGIDRDTVIELLKMLVDQTMETNDKLWQAIEAADHEEIALLAHDIKGSCGNFRLVDLYETAAEIERGGKNKVSADHLVQLHGTLARRLTDYQEQLRDY